MKLRCKKFYFRCCLLCTFCLTRSTNRHTLNSLRYLINSLSCWLTYLWYLLRCIYKDTWLFLNSLDKTSYLICHIIVVFLNLSEFVLPLYFYSVCKITISHLTHSSVNLLKLFRDWPCCYKSNSNTYYDSYYWKKHCPVSDAVYNCLCLWLAYKSHKSPACNCILRRYNMKAFTIYFFIKRKCCIKLVITKSLYSIPAFKLSNIIYICILVIINKNLAFLINEEDITCIKKTYISYIIFNLWEVNIKAYRSIVTVICILYFLGHSKYSLSRFWILIWIWKYWIYRIPCLWTYTCFIPWLVRIINISC